MVSGQPLVAETLAEGLVPPVPVGYCEVVVELPGEVEGVPPLPWQAVSTRTARATAANLTGWPIQYPISLDSTNPLKEPGLKTNVRSAKDEMLKRESGPSPTGLGDVPPKAVIHCPIVWLCECSWEWVPPESSMAPPETLAKQRCPRDSVTAAV